ncbi:hypothetical protein A0U89_15955 (plasmid) [Kozakia baliensis]|uniref:Uncharacterized protein n=1 Tax=Kozakia baliensis TaxID=153496 RepID=A0A1D8UYS3_9PROT|nr:hypothetical protein A0U89_15955 [Kozakia baliensis]
MIIGWPAMRQTCLTKAGMKKGHFSVLRIFRKDFKSLLNPPLQNFSLLWGSCFRDSLFHCFVEPDKLELFAVVLHECEPLSHNASELAVKQKN